MYLKNNTSPDAILRRDSQTFLLSYGYIISFVVFLGCVTCYIILYLVWVIKLGFCENIRNNGFPSSLIWDVLPLYLPFRSYLYNPYPLLIYYLLSIFYDRWSQSKVLRNMHGSSVFVFIRREESSFASFLTYCLYKYQIIVKVFTDTIRGSCRLEIKIYPHFAQNCFFCK